MKFFNTEMSGIILKKVPAQSVQAAATFTTVLSAALLKRKQVYHYVKVEQLKNLNLTCLSLTILLLY